jgi:hypothetical protein
MATGCATVGGLYGAVLAFVNHDHVVSSHSCFFYELMLPFVLFIISGFVFGNAYLPDERLSDLITSGLPDENIQVQRLIAREKNLRRRIVARTFWFVLATATALVNIAWSRAD